MISHDRILEAIVPRDSAATAVDMRVLLRRGLRRRLRMAAMLVSARPARADDPKLFGALVDQIEARPTASRDEFFDHPEVAAWLIALLLDPAAVTVIRSGDLLALISRASGSVGARETPRLYFGPPADLPHLSSALSLAATADKLDLATGPVPECARARWERDVAAAFAALKTVWPGMAAMAVLHIAALVVHEGQTTTSHRHFAGTVVLSAARLDEAGRGNHTAIGEALAHETTHQALYCLQEEGPLIDPPSSARFVSPWSGATRSLLLAAHIAPVYFAVIEYLHRLRLAGSTDEQASAARIRHLLAGMDRFFAEATGRPYLTPVGRMLHEQVQDAVSRRRAAYLGS